MSDPPPPSPAAPPPAPSGDPAPAEMARFFAEVMDIAPADPSVPDHPGLRAARADGFEARAVLGVGGVGEVWRATDHNTSGEVAIKVRKQAGAQEAGTPHVGLAAEAAALTRLRHPGVVRLIRQGGAGASEFLVLELVEGLPLDQFVRSAAPSPNGLLRLFERVCGAVGAVHAANLIHADLKPSNILVRDDGVPVLIDLGLACRPGGEGTAVARRVVRGGTDRFLAPELRRGAAAPGRASDIYALGQTFRWVGGLNRARPAGLASVLAGACADDPRARPPSAAALSGRIATLRRRPAVRRRRRRWAGVSAGLAAAAWALALAWPAGVPVAGQDPAAAGVTGVLTRAQTRLNDGDAAAARAVLAGVPGRARGWEWRHLFASATRPPGVSSVRYPEPGMSSALSPDGGHALVGTAQGHLYRTALDGRTDSLHRGEGVVSHVAVIDAHRFAAVSLSGQVLAGDATGVRQVSRVDGAPSVCWPSPDAARLWGWGAVTGEVFAADLHAPGHRAAGRAQLVLAAPSSPGWAWAVTEGGHAQAGAAAPTRTHTLMRPGWTADRTDRWSAGELPVAVDHDADRGSTVLGTLGGALRYYPGPERPAVTWPIADHPLTAVVLCEPERRVFAVGDRLYVFDLDRARVMLTLPVDLPGLVRSIRWNPADGALTVATDLAMTQWKAPHAGAQLASR